MEDRRLIGQVIVWKVRPNPIMRPKYLADINDGYVVVLLERFKLSLHCCKLSA